MENIKTTNIELTKKDLAELIYLLILAEMKNIKTTNIELTKKDLAKLIYLLIIAEDNINKSDYDWYNSFLNKLNTLYKKEFGEEKEE